MTEFCLNKDLRKLIDRVVENRKRMILEKDDEKLLLDDEPADVKFSEIPSGEDKNILIYYCSQNEYNFSTLFNKKRTRKGSRFTIHLPIIQKPIPA